MKMHPYIQMEGVGDKLEIVNEDAYTSTDFNIQNLMTDRYNQSLKDKLGRTALCLSKAKS